MWSPEGHLPNAPQWLFFILTALARARRFATFHCPPIPAPSVRGRRDWLIWKGIRIMQATLAELAALVGGQIVGDGDLVIRGAASLRDAQPGQITLVDRAGEEPSLGDLPSGGRRCAPELRAEKICRHPGRRRASGVCRSSCVTSVRRVRRRASASARWPWSARRPRSARTSTSIRSPPSATTWRSAPARRSTRGVHIMAGSQIGAGRDDLPQRRALREHDRRAAVRDPRQRRAGGLRLRLRLASTAGTCCRPSWATWCWGPTWRSAPARRSIAAPTARRSSARARRSTTW